MYIEIDTAQINILKKKVYFPCFSQVEVLKRKKNNDQGEPTAQPSTAAVH